MKLKLSEKLISWVLSKTSYAMWQVGIH